MTITFPLYEKHMELVQAVNNAKTVEEHSHAEQYLRGWREGVTASDGYMRLMDADNFYLEQGIERPMCCGVWLDWKPEPVDPLAWSKAAGVEEF